VIVFLLAWFATTFHSLLVWSPSSAAVLQVLTLPSRRGGLWTVGVYGKIRWRFSLFSTGVLRGEDTLVTGTDFCGQHLRVARGCVMLS
jgi:hypothetical protein